jgi:[ribosomal protein S5]-alanine N-acetyltransferase
MFNLEAETIQTSRLLLRRPQIEDADELFESVTSDATVVQLVGWPRHTDCETTRRVLGHADDSWREHGVGPFVVVDPKSQSLLGTTGLHLSGSGAASTGYVLARSAWGRGLASEALAAMVQLAARLGLREVTAFVHPQNLKSIRVLHKLDFELQCSERSEFFPNIDAGVSSPVLDYTRALQ